MKHKLIKKYLDGNSIADAKALYEQRLAMQELVQKYYEEHPEEAVKSRHGLFAYLPVRYAEGVKPYINAFTGKPILDGENILTRDGKIVLADSLDWLDWLAETGQTLPGLTLPEVHIEYNPKTKETRKYTGTSWEDMNASKTNAPIATNALWEELALENFEANDLIKLLMQKRLADRIANAKTPGVGSLALLGAFGTMAAWNPIAFAASLGAAKLGETTLNYPFLLQGYKSFEDWLFEGTNAPDWLKDNSNLGALLGGGTGWSLANKYLATTKNLIKHTALDALKKSILSNYYNLTPRYVEDAIATEISSKIPQSTIRQPAVLFSEIGDVNEGSLLSALLKGIRETNLTKITGENFLDIPSSKILEAYTAAKNVGLEQRAIELFRLYKEKLQIENGGKSLIPEDPKGHWLIRSLLPGNPLSKRVSPNGMVSLKNVEWYLRQPSVSAYDKTHISNALLLLPKINGLVNYNSLLRASSEIIPLLEPRPESEYAKVGLSALGFNKVRYNPELRSVENPKETILPFTHSFHPQKGRLLPKSSRHYKDAYGHNRYFVDKLNPNTLNVLEILNDAALANSHQGLPLYKHMNDTFFLRLILEALLTAHNTGLDKVRFPTSKTAGIIEGYPHDVSPEGKEAIKALLQEKKNALEELELKHNPYKKRLEMMREAKLQEYNDNTWKYDSLYSYLCRKYGLTRLISRDDLYNGPLDYFGDSPEAIADMEKFKMLGDMRLASYDEYVDLLKKSSASQGGTAYINELVGLKRHYDELVNNLQKAYASFSSDYDYILNRYAKFPKTFKGLFGSLAKVNVVTDRMGNPWFEVDVPLDIATRNLIFNKVGDINSGSLLSLLQNAAKSLKTSLRDSIVKSGTNILNEYYFWKNLKTDKNLLENIYAGAIEKIPTTLRPKVQQGLDDAAVDELLRNTVGRRIAAFLKDEAAGLVPKSSTNIMKKGVDEARQALETVKIGLFPDLAFDLTELRVAKGFVNGPRTFVGYRDSLPLVEKFLTLVHEGDHIVDTTYPLSPTQLKVINEAFDENFLELPKRLKYYKLWGYKGMESEATTTTTEARASLLNRYNIFDSTIEAQNKFISSLSDKEIFNTIENVNGYGRYYIDWLRRNKKLTPEKAELFRQAMIVCAKTGEINEGSVIGATSRRSQPLMPARSHPLVDLFRLLWPTWTNGSLGYGHKYRVIGRNKGLHDVMENGIRSKAKEYNDIDEVYWAQDAPLREYTKKSPLLLRYDKNGKAVFRTGNDLNPVSSAKNPISFWDPNVTLHGRWPFYSGYHEIPKTEEGIKHAEMLNNLNRFIETPVRKGVYGYLYYKLLNLLFNNKLNENKKDQAN